MYLFDTHFHYDGKVTPPEFVRTVPEAEFYYLCTGADLASSQLALEFARQIPHAFAAVGLHPEYVAEWRRSKPDFGEFKGLPEVKAIGEIGLDYYYGTPDKTGQIALFEEFLQLALAWQLPAVVHLRDRDGQTQVYSDALAILRNFAQSGGRFDLHCCAAPLDYAEKFWAMGGYTGVTGMVTFNKGDNIRELVRNAPLAQLLIETDSPYLSPVPHRGEVNHPANVIFVARKIAEIRDMTLETVAETTFNNGLRFLEVGDGFCN